MTDQRLAVPAAVLAGLAVMGAAPAPAPGAATGVAEAAIAKIFPAPRLFKVEVTHQAPPPKTDTVQMCMGAESMRPFLELAEARPDLVAELNKGCTHNRVQAPDGRVKVEMACDRAAGAAWTAHMTIEGAADLHELRQHMEMNLGGKLGTVVQDTHMTMLGDCPADLKPGQMRLASGEVFDGGGMLDAVAKAAPPKP